MKIYTIKSVVEMLGVSEQRVYKALSRYRGKGIRRMGNMYFVTENAIKQLRRLIIDTRGVEVKSSKGIKMDFDKVRKEYMGVAEYARIRGVARQAVYQQIERKKKPLPFEVINGHYKIKRSLV